MMFRQRGLRGLINHRAKRILLPLVVFTILLSPAIIGIMIYGNALSAEARRQGATIWAAARSGDVEAIRTGTWPDGVGCQPAGRRRAHSPVVGGAAWPSGRRRGAHRVSGADVDATANDGTTALHCAAFMGEAAVVQAAGQERGRHQRRISDDGGTPLSATEADDTDHPVHRRDAADSRG